MSKNDVVRARIAREKELPKEPLVPNKETLNAIKEVRQGKNLKSFNTVDDLMADLNSEGRENESI